MQARTRRNRVAVLLSMTLCFTSTCEFPGDRAAAQRSRAANIAFAAETVGLKNKADEQAALGSGSADGSLGTGADGYQVADWWKADLSEYDQSLTLVSYEAAYTEPDETLTMNTAATTETSSIYSENSEEIYSSEAVPAISEVTPDYSYSADSRESIPYEPVTYEPVVYDNSGYSSYTAAGSADAYENVVFYSSGYGHGVGMSQNGANFYAMYDGWTYDQILNFYYPGTSLVQTGTSEYDVMTVNGKTDTVVSILSQICYNEMGPTFSIEAIKAQAVAAYSYYLYNGYGAGMICKANPPQSIIDAVRSVLGIVVYYNGAPALTSFYASSGGTTASCKDIFYADIPYLRSIPVRYDDVFDPHYNSSISFSQSTLKSVLENSYHVQLTGNPYDWIQLEYGDGGYVAYAVIGGQVRVKGNELRSVLGLKSPKYYFVCS